MSATSPVRTPASPAVETPLPEAPERAWRWLTTELSGQDVPPVIALIGLGDGALLEALDVRAPGTKVLALEPDPAAARTVLAKERTDAWRQSGRLVYLSGPDYAGADNAWRIFPTHVEPPPMLVHPGSANVPGVARAVSVFRKIVFGAVANANARKKFAPRYLLNSIRNLPGIISGRDVRALANAAVGVPAVVVGAGPSLDNSMEELARLRGRAVIIATDTALRPLLTRGIVPQLVVGLDPSDINARHLLALPECRDTWLVAESALDPRAASEFDGRTFWFRVAPHHPWPWYNEQGVDVGRLDVWGSVLTGAFQVACLAGCDPVVTLGADLSFPGGRPYARGTTYEFDWAWAASFGTTLEQTWRNQMAGRNDLRSEVDLTGADVPTTGAMLQFRDWMVAHARKSGRRLLNATGAGMLFGEGVEQATLAEALTQDIELPSFAQRGRPAAVVSRKAMARNLRALRADLASGKLDKWPLSGWIDFSGAGFDAALVGTALADSALQLERTNRLAGPTPKEKGGRNEVDGLLASLPEASTHLGLALRGDALPASEPDALDPVAREGLLVSALDHLRQIVASVAEGADFVSMPDPDLIGKVSAGGICMWPEAVRWNVQLFEAQLARAWKNVVAPPTRQVVLFGDVDTRRSVDGPRKANVLARPYATHACLLLATEWLRCVSSQDEAMALVLGGVTDRLWSIEQWLRDRPPSASRGSQAELVIEARWSEGRKATTVVLPLGASDESLARMLTGALQSADGAIWELARACAGVDIRVGVRAQGTRVATWPAATAVARMPRAISLGGARLKVADQLPEGALCVVDFTNQTVLVTPDGQVQPYQTWPRQITGALSIGDAGDVAWSNVLGSGPDGPRPYLMHRPSPHADVATLDLSFRPARGVWWRDRLYLTGLPTGEARGGIGSWAPGEKSVVLEQQDLTLQAVLPHGDCLLLEPYALGKTEGFARERVEQGWTWTPGQAPTRRSLGRRGAASALAVSDTWTARAYPQADEIVFEASDGRRLSMRCYMPMRLAWAGDALVVFTGDRHLLLFEHLIDALDGAR